MRRGDVYWVEFDGVGSEPFGYRPAVVIQHDRYNRSKLRTTIVAAITSNLRKAERPGNVQLHKGEANLPRASVVNVTQIETVDRSRLTDPIGTLSRARVNEIVNGLALVLGFDDI